MKRKRFIFMCAGFMTFALVLGIVTLFPKESKELKNIPYHADTYKYSYEELKEDSQVIALIEVMDELTAKNSEGITSQGYMVGNVGRRQVKVLKYFKNERSYGDILTILEPASIIGNQYIRPENYEKLEKGNQYLVFLSDDTATAELSLMSAGNGTFHMNNFNDMDEYFDLAVKSVVDYMTDLADEQKEKIISTDEIVKTNYVENTDIEAEVTGIQNKMELNLGQNINGKMQVQVIDT